MGRCCSPEKPFTRLPLLLHSQEWGTDEIEYFHLNIRLNHIQVSDAVTGVMGDSARLKYDSDEQPILKAHDADGAGILDHPVDFYQVDSILSTPQSMAPPSQGTASSTLRMPAQASSQDSN